MEEIMMIWCCVILRDGFIARNGELDGRDILGSLFWVSLLHYYFCFANIFMKTWRCCLSIATFNVIFMDWDL